MKKITSSFIVIMMLVASFSACDKIEEIQKDVCEDEVNQRDLIKVTLVFKVNLIYSPIDNRKVKISMQKQYCDGHFPNPILSAGNSTGAGYYSTQGFFDMENALDKIIISIEMEEETQNGKYYVAETTIYYDDFNPLVPVFTLKCNEEGVDVIQGWTQ